VKVVIGVHIGVMCPSTVIERVLDELECRDADPVEGEMIGAAHSFRTDSRGPEVVQRLEPGREYWFGRRVLLRIDPSDLPGAVVHVEVDRMPDMSRLRLDGPGSFAESLRQLQLFGVGDLGPGGQVFLDVSL